MSLDWTIMCTSSMIEMSHPWTIIIFKRKKDSSLSCLGPKHTNRWMGNANRCKPEPSHIEKTLFTVTRESNIYHSRQRLISIYRHMIRWALRPPENFHGPPSTKAKRLGEILHPQLSRSATTVKPSDFHGSTFYANQSVRCLIESPQV